MHEGQVRISYVIFENNKYPAAHWEKLKRFAVGKVKDPLKLFLLRANSWEAWRYAENGRKTEASKYRFRFHDFKSFLKPYVKWYCYQRLVANAGPLRLGLSALPYHLLNADRYIIEHDYLSVDDITSLLAFSDLWDAQITGDVVKDGSLPHSAVIRQEQTRAFWRRMRLEFSFPYLVPRVALHIKNRPAHSAMDRSKLIPEQVIEQFGNKLGLHRDGKSLLRSFDHLRLCVLMLGICLGRRVWEIFSLPRGPKRSGPLSRHPAASGSPEGALWFRFIPNKNGRDDMVYVSPEWEDLVTYCVRELIKYGDQVRCFASPEERELLILISRCNQTKGGINSCHENIADRECNRSKGNLETDNAGKCNSTALTAKSFHCWLNGFKSGKNYRNGYKGVLEKWNITANGAVDGPVYSMKLSYVRHSRQSALVLDPQITALTLQRDLNHNDRDMQSAYQHRLKENNASFLQKIKEGKIVGHGGEWVANLFDLPIQERNAQSCFKSGCPSALTPRFRNLIKNNPLFVQMNRVPGGICSLPQGPEGCLEFMNCTCAGEGGCSFFMTDVTDEQMLLELDGMARDERRHQQESIAAGRLVQAEKREVRARRTEELRDEALRIASREIIEWLHEKRREIDEKGL
jgi:hypothetical protein